MICQLIASALREEVGIEGYVTNDDLERICEHLDLEVQEIALPGTRASEFMIGDIIVLRAGLEPCWRRWHIAHAIGHHLAHCGNHFKMDPIRIDQQERQAEEFAGWLLCSGIEAHVCQDESITPWDFAEDAMIPEECARVWLRRVHRQAKRKYGRGCYVALNA